jgi:hypothetical protein
MVWCKEVSFLSIACSFLKRSFIFFAINSLLPNPHCHIALKCFFHFVAVKPSIVGFDVINGLEGVRVEYNIQKARSPNQRFCIYITCFRSTTKRSCYFHTSKRFTGSRWHTHVLCGGWSSHRVICPLLLQQPKLCWPNRHSGWKQNVQQYYSERRNWWRRKYDVHLFSYVVTWTESLPERNHEDLCDSM